VATKRTVTITAADPKAGMTLHELTHALEEASASIEPDATLKARLTMGGKLKSVTITEGD
jgi:hypothetical protein